MSTDSDVPKGKVSCLLCRGFISYKNSDRTRFKDHMLNEHDVKFDSDVILAVSVMSQKEKAFIVKSSLQRLGEISNNQIPSSGESLIPPPPVAPTPTPSQRQPNPTTRPGNPRGRPPGVRPENAQPQRMQFGPRATSLQVGRPRPNPVPPQHAQQQQQQQMQRQSPGARMGSPQIPRSAAPAPLPQLPPNFPQHLGVSISRIDPSVKCDMCKIVLPNSEMLAEHMKVEHLSRFSGLVIATPSEKSNKRQSLPAAANLTSSSILPVRPSPPIQQVPSKRPRTVETPINFNKLGLKAPSRNVAGQSQNFSPQSNRMMRKVPQSNSNTKPHTLPHKSFSSPSRPPIPTSVQPTVSSPVEEQPSPPIQEQAKPDPVIKCNTCSQFVKQSVFKSHKLSHPQGPKQEKKVLKDAGKKELTEPIDIAPKHRRREEKQIDFVDLGDSDDESTVSNVPKTVEKNIQCPACEKKLATNMALKMHMNMKHPVKSEVVDTEELLAEESDEKTKDKEGSQDKIRDEVENMETLELLDNLVNFLNDT